MGDTWITDLRHFLHEDGTIADLPSPAARLANYFGSIVEAVTAREENDKWLTGIRCRRRPRRKPCQGEIIAFLDERNDFTIAWRCPVCGDSGFISGWQDTVWDLR